MSEKHRQSDRHTNRMSEKHTQTDRQTYTTERDGDAQADKGAALHTEAQPVAGEQRVEGRKEGGGWGRWRSMKPIGRRSIHQPPTQVLSTDKQTPSVALPLAR